MQFRMVAGAEDINAGLAPAILARREKDQGNRISNVGGWQSRSDVLEWPELAVKLCTRTY